MSRPDWHRITDVDEKSKIGLCQICGTVSVRKRYKKRKDGSDMYRCQNEYSRRRNLSKRPYRIHLKKSCEMCGFMPQHEIQMDIDHIDGNSKNNDLSNLQTLCANCHRLKTFINRDFDNKK